MYGMLARFVLAELVRETQDEAETTPAVGSSAPHLQLTMLKEEEEEEEVFIEIMGFGC